jgi:hypothetical protein
VYQINSFVSSVAFFGAGVLDLQISMDMHTFTAIPANSSSHQYWQHQQSQALAGSWGTWGSGCVG